MVLSWLTVWALVVTVLAACEMPGVTAATPPPPAEIETVIVTGHLTLRAGETLAKRLVIRAGHVIIDGNGATLVGPGRTGDANSLAAAGVGILADGVSHVTLRNLTVRGFATGLVVTDAQGWWIENCEFSHNYHNPVESWKPQPIRGGIVLRRVRDSVLRANRANHVWDGLALIDSHANTITANEFAKCSNAGMRLWTSTRNTVMLNRLARGFRLTPDAVGQLNPHESCGLLIQNGSDANLIYANDMTHSGNGLLMRAGSWVSRGNMVVENDTSHAYANGVECGSPGNVFVRNRANYCTHGFWMAGSDQTRLLNNEASHNGQGERFARIALPEFGHGGIVFAGGWGTHVIVDGNRCESNRGAGIVFAGGLSRTPDGQPVALSHWVIQRNQLHGNKWSLWGRQAERVWLANNFAEGHSKSSIEGIIPPLSPRGDPTVTEAPSVFLNVPDRLRVGEKLTITSDNATDATGRTLYYTLDLTDFGTEPAQFTDPNKLTLVPSKPGCLRLTLRTDNGVLADMGWRDVLVSHPVAYELGTEANPQTPTADRWGFVFTPDTHRASRVVFTDDSDALVGRTCLRWTPNPYSGEVATITLSAKASGLPAEAWRAHPRGNLAFWMRAVNPNPGGWQGDGPVITLRSGLATLTLKPSRGHYLRTPLNSQARCQWWYWQVPLAGSRHWQATIAGGDFNYSAIESLSFSLDSFDRDPFTVWLDGLHFEEPTPAGLPTSR